MFVLKIRMAVAPKIKKNTFIEFSFILLKNSQGVKRRKSF